MEQKTLQTLAKRGEVEEVVESTPDEKKSQELTPEEMQDAVRLITEYMPIIQALRKLKRPLTSAPTNIPKNFTDMFEVYDTGGVRRLYIYVGTAWRYVVLT